MIVFHLYKMYGNMMYPPYVWELEFLGLFMLTFVQLIRVYYGFQANRSESRKAAIIFFVLTVLSMLVIIHFSFLTTYVLLIEILLSVVILALALMELIQSLIAIKRFKS